jgi:hypothetical protein
MAQSRRNFLRELSRVVQENDGPITANLLGKVVDFVLQGDFSSYRDAKELILTQSLTDVSKTLSVEEAADRMGISKNNFIKRRTQISQELYGLFGDDFFERVSQVPLPRGLEDLVNNVVEGINVFDYVPKEVVARASWLSQQNHTDKNEYDPRDCIDELNFLRKYSQPIMWHEFSKLDKGKLNYLLGILEGKGSVRDREGILHQLVVKEK